MTTTFRSWFARAACLVALFGLSGGTAFADLLQVQGSTSGQFYSTPLPPLVPAIPLGSSIGGLTFTGSNFGPTGEPEIDLGTFSLATLFSIFDPVDFKLSVEFTAPAGAGGSTFTADLSGLVSIIDIDHDGPDYVKVDFRTNGPKTFAFTNSQGSGSFDLSISDVNVRNGSSQHIKGSISNATFAATPEPTAVVLTGTLVGVAIVLFRKRLGIC